MAEGDTLVNAVLGAVVTAVLASFVPFAPVAGGMAAGYLQGGDRDDGLRVGTLSGVVGLIPLVLFGAVVANVLFLFVGGMMGMPRRFGGLGALAIVAGLLFVSLYTVGLSAVGGWLGNYVRYDTDIGD